MTNNARRPTQDYDVEILGVALGLDGPVPVVVGAGSYADLDRALHEGDLAADASGADDVERRLLRSGHALAVLAENARAIIAAAQQEGTEQG